MSRSVAGQPVHREAKTLETILTALTILVVAVASVFAIVDTVEMGRAYLFSRQFLDELPRRIMGPGRLRILLQPTVAIVLGVRGGLADARAGRPTYLTGLFSAAGRRREMLRSGVAAIRNLLAMAIILELVFQLVLYRSVHPGAALVVGLALICVPYALSRSLTRWVAGRSSGKAEER